MPKEKEQKYIIVKHDEIKVIEVTWLGKITSEEFRAGNDAMLNELINSSSTKAIIDMEKITFSVSEDDHSWFKNYFIPKALQSNLNSIAFIQPGPFNTLSIANLLYPYFPTEMNFEIFDSFETASKWIHRQCRD